MPCTWQVRGTRLVCSGPACWRSKLAIVAFGRNAPVRCIAQDRLADEATHGKIPQFSAKGRFFRLADLLNAAPRDPGTLGARPPRRSLPIQLLQLSIRRALLTETSPELASRTDAAQTLPLGPSTPDDLSPSNPHTD